MSIRSILFLLAGCLLLTGGCNVGTDIDTGKTIEELREELVGTTWELRSINEEGFGVFVSESDTLYDIQFFNDGTFEASVECNTCTGNYEITTNYGLTTSNLECTLRSCQTVIHSFPYNTALFEATTFVVQRNELFINSRYNEQPNQVAIHRNRKSTAAKEVVMANPENFTRSNWPDGAYDISNISVTADSVAFRVNYSGCHPNDFNLVFNDYFSGSFPVEAHAVLAHRNEECDAAFSRRVKFDLTPLRAAYFDEYGEGPGEVRIVIQEGETKHAQVLYDFFK